MSMTDGRPASIRRASRIGPLANLPVFFKLDGKRVVLAGGGEPALWKAELLAATGALVEVFAETFAEGFQELAAAPPNGEIVLAAKRWSADDLRFAALAIGSFTDEDEATAFAAAARSAGVPVNVVDRPALCDFQFGAIVNRSPLVVGISTDGAAPVFGQALRSLIESLLPQSFRFWAEAARDLRRRGDAFGNTPDEKRRFWQRFADFALRHAERGPSAADIDELTREGAADSAVQPVALVDIGPDADALTLGAVRVLRTADDIFFDDGIQPAILDFARREARRHLVASTNANIQELADNLIQAAANGGRVVRLKRLSGVDQGKLLAEADALRAAGVSVRVIATAVPPLP